MFKILIDLSFCFLFQLLFCPVRRFCVCMLHMQFEKLLHTLLKVILAHHGPECMCPCAFCDNCSVDFLSIKWMMEHMFCPSVLVFPGSTKHLHRWQCIAGEYVHTNSSHVWFCLFHILYIILFCFQMQFMHAKQRGNAIWVPQITIVAQWGLNFLSSLRGNRFAWGQL